MKCSQPTTSNLRSTQSISFANQLIEKPRAIGGDQPILHNYLNARTITTEGTIIPINSITGPKVTTVTARPLTEVQQQIIRDMNIQALRELQFNASLRSQFP
jgi:hypothetical protein